MAEGNASVFLELSLDLLAHFVQLFFDVVDLFVGVVVGVIDSCLRLRQLNTTVSILDDFPHN